MTRHIERLRTAALVTFKLTGCQLVRHAGVLCFLPTLPHYPHVLLSVRNRTAASSRNVTPPMKNTTTTLRRRPVGSAQTVHAPQLQRWLAPHAMVHRATTITRVTQSPSSRDRLADRDTHARDTAVRSTRVTHGDTTPGGQNTGTRHCTSSWPASVHVRQNPSAPQHVATRPPKSPTPHRATAITSSASILQSCSQPRSGS